eukprot:7911902-Pyramimonas_sp.AAC.1
MEAKGIPLRRAGGKFSGRKRRPRCLNCQNFMSRRSWQRARPSRALWAWGPTRGTPNSGLLCLRRRAMS